MSEQRIAKKVNGVITEKYLWAGLTGLLAVYDASDTLVARFEYAGGPLPVKMVQSGATYYLAYDQVGSLRAVLNASGTVVHQITYDTFGNILAESASGLCVPFGFAGGLHDRATSLVRFGHRDYDPDTGRWTSKDPVKFVGGSTNLYAYCLNNPVSLSDRRGLAVMGVGGSLTGELWVPGTAIGGGLNGGGMLIADSTGTTGGLGYFGPGAGVVATMLSGSATVDVYMGSGTNTDMSGATITVGGSLGAFGLAIGADVVQSATNPSVHGIQISFGFGTPGAEGHYFLTRGAYREFSNPQDAAAQLLDDQLGLIGAGYRFSQPEVYNPLAIPEPSIPKIRTS